MGCIGRLGLRRSAAVSDLCECQPAAAVTALVGEMLLPL